MSIPGQVQNFQPTQFPASIYPEPVPGANSSADCASPVASSPSPAESVQVEAKPASPFQATAGTNGVTQVTVAKGDNLWTLLKNQGFSNSEIAKLVPEVASQNQLRDPNLIHPDQTLTLPSKLEANPDAPTAEPQRPGKVYGTITQDSHEFAAASGNTAEEVIGDATQRASSVRGDVANNIGSVTGRANQSAVSVRGDVNNVVVESGGSVTQNGKSTFGSVRNVANSTGGNLRQEAVSEFESADNIAGSVAGDAHQSASSFAGNARTDVGDVGGDLTASATSHRGSAQVHTRDVAGNADVKATSENREAVISTSADGNINAEAQGRTFDVRAFSGGDNTIQARGQDGRIDAASFAGDIDISASGRASTTTIGGNNINIQSQGGTDKIYTERGGQEPARVQNIDKDRWGRDQVGQLFLSANKDTVVDLQGNNAGGTTTLVANGHRLEGTVATSKGNDTVALDLRAGGDVSDLIVQGGVGNDRLSIQLAEGQSLAVLGTDGRVLVSSPGWQEGGATLKTEGLEQVSLLQGDQLVEGSRKYNARGRGAGFDTKTVTIPQGEEGQVFRDLLTARDYSSVLDQANNTGSADNKIGRVDFTKASERVEYPQDIRNAFARIADNKELWNSDNSGAWGDAINDSSSMANSVRSFFGREESTVTSVKSLSRAVDNFIDNL